MHFDCYVFPHKLFRQDILWQIPKYVAIAAESGEIGELTGSLGTLLCKSTVVQNVRFGRDFPAIYSPRLNLHL